MGSPIQFGPTGMPIFPGQPNYDPWHVGYGAGTHLPATTDEAKAAYLEAALGARLALAYGRHLVGGTPFLSDYDSAAGVTKLFIANGEGPWNALTKLWIDSVLKDETDTDLVHFHPGLDGVAGTESVPGTPNQKICSFFPAALTGTTFSRTAYLALAIPDDPASPGPSFDVRGIYETRLVRIFDATGAETSFAYSANPAWQLLDAFISLYLKPHGAVDEALTTAEKAQIDFSAFVDAADYCDADIGGGIKRFESHVFFKEATNLRKIFETIAATCRGYCRQNHGQLGLYIDQPRASIFTFDTDKIINLSFETSAPDLRSAVNRLVVKIRDLDSGGADASKDFAPFPKTLNAEDHQAQVGRVISQEIDLGANTKERTTRLGSYWLLRGLLEKHSQLRATQDAGAVMPGDRVLGYVDQAMVSTGDWEVTEATDEPDGSRQIALQEYNEAIMSDVAAATQDLEETVVSFDLAHELAEGAARGYDDVQSLYAIQDASGNPFNPLSATTAGTVSKIDIQPFYLLVDAVSIAVLSAAAQISGLTPGVKYYVYFDDPTLAGGSVTMLATVNLSDVENAAGRIYVGAITTPQTTSGSAVVYRPSTYLDFGTSLTYNPEKAYDGSTGTCSEGAAYTDGDGSYTSVIYYSGFTDPAAAKSSVTLKINSTLAANNSKGGKLSYTIDGGANWVDVYDQDTTRANTTDSIALADGQDWSLVQVYAETRAPVASLPGGILDLFDIRIEGTLA